MQFISLGTVSSEAELAAVRQRSKGNADRLCEYVSLLKDIDALEARGIAAEAGRWISVARFADVKVFVGDKGVNRTAIWAAVETGTDGRSVTLLKVVDRYQNDMQQHEGLLQDALDRKERGTRYG